MVFLSFSHGFQRPWPGEALAVLVLDVHVDGGDWGDGRLPEVRRGSRSGRPIWGAGGTMEKTWENWAKSHGTHMGNPCFRQGNLMVCYCFFLWNLWRS